MTSKFTKVIVAISDIWSQNQLAAVRGSLLRGFNELNNNVEIANIFGDLTPVPVLAGNQTIELPSFTVQIMKRVKKSELLKAIKILGFKRIILIYVGEIADNIGQWLLGDGVVDASDVLEVLNKEECKIWVAAPLPCKNWIRKAKHLKNTIDVCGYRNEGEEAGFLGAFVDSICAGLNVTYSGEEDVCLICYDEIEAENICYFEKCYYEHKFDSVCFTTQLHGHDRDNMTLKCPYDQRENAVVMLHGVVMSITDLVATLEYLGKKLDEEMGKKPVEVFKEPVEVLGEWMDDELRIRKSEWMGKVEELGLVLGEELGQELGQEMETEKPRDPELVARLEVLKEALVNGSRIPYGHCLACFEDLSSSPYWFGYPACWETHRLCRRCVSKRMSYWCPVSRHSGKDYLGNGYCLVREGRAFRLDGEFMRTLVDDFVNNLPLTEADQAMKDELHAMNTLVAEMTEIF